MSLIETAQALANITDAGLFERLATAVLREDNSDYHSLAHPGVNVEGKTVKSPLDGICFVQGSNPPHMIAVHHTIASRDKLKDKWLHNPSTVNPRKGSRPTAPAGDLIKTAKLVAEERKRTPNLAATLILTTNVEPSETLVRDVNAIGRNHDVRIDLWSGSRLSHFLNNNPSGQWIRYSFLGIEQEQLSSKLLSQLSRRSLEIQKPLDDPAAWIPRMVDNMLADNLSRDVTFLVARSGLGKSVACYRKLVSHVESGGWGIILPHEVVASEITLEQAVMKTLRQLHPSLSTAATTALSFCSPNQPLLLVVEDINRSGKAQLLLEKLASWSRIGSKGQQGISGVWHLLCPVWPEIIASSSEQVRQRIKPLLSVAGGFTEIEGRDAVMARTQLIGRNLSLLNAESVARALGYDPLLIALHDSAEMPDASQVIGQFVNNALSRTSAERQDYLPADYRQALRILGGEMLTRHQIELSWSEVVTWSNLQGENLHLLRHLARQGELVQQTESSENQQLIFRHDRVRDWILADAIVSLERQGFLDNQIVAEPYFSGVIGIALIQDGNSSLLRQVASSNPLALFHALRLFGESREPHHEAILKAIYGWLDHPATHEMFNNHLRWKALIILSETDSSEVPKIVERFPDHSIDGFIASLRNGLLSGGIRLCLNIKPRIEAPWRDTQIEHAKLYHLSTLTDNLKDFLKQPSLSGNARIGALRFSGYISDPSLALALEECWINDDERGEHLDEYLWAFRECCANDPVRFLSPVCSAWAALSDQKDEYGLSPRNSLATHGGIRQAFRQQPPPCAVIDHFIQYALQGDLRWPITYMLHGIDHPKALSFVVQEFSAHRSQADETGSISFYEHHWQDHWQDEQERGRPMSELSRNLLLEIWEDEANDDYLRSQAFSFWAATKQPTDTEILHMANSSEALSEDIFRARLIRGDRHTIPALIDKLVTDERGLWWQYGKYLWSSELTDALDNFFERRGAQSQRFWGESFESDWITHELIMRLSINEAERLLLKHWNHLRFNDDFVQTAIYIATPRTLEIASITISEHPKPADLLEHLAFRYGIQTIGHSGITRKTQISALAPYLHLLSSLDIRLLWIECNNHGWFDIRRQLLDEHLNDKLPLHQQLRWNREESILALDKMIEEEELIWIGRWIDDFLKTDVSWQEILSTMTIWLHERNSFEALKAVAAAIQHQGSRKDLAVLRACEISSNPDALQLIANTEFAVRLRNIH